MIYDNALNRIVKNNLIYKFINSLHKKQTIIIKAVPTIGEMNNFCIFPILMHLSIFTSKSKNIQKLHNAVIDDAPIAPNFGITI